nr:WD40 repeat domain-containing protein [uncultured Bacillus sp.]
MKLLKLFLPVILLSLVITACSDKSYAPIAKEKNIIITINIKDMTVTFVDAVQHKKLAQWEMDKPYSGGLLLPDKDTLVLYGKQVETVDLYSLSSGKWVDSWNTGKGIANGRVLQNQKELVLVDQARNQARFFTTGGKETKSVITGQNPFTILEGKDKLYIININDENLTVIKKDMKETAESFKIHTFAAGALLRENQNELWVGGHGSGTEAESDIHVYQMKDGAMIRTIKAPLMPVNFTELDGCIYVISHGSNTLYKLSEEGNQIQSVQIGANPFELSIFHDELIVAGYDSNAIYFVEPNNLEIKHQVQVGKGPFQLIVRESK